MTIKRAVSDVEAALFFLTQRTPGVSRRDTKDPVNFYSKNILPFSFSPIKLKKSVMNENQITKIILDTAFEVHSLIGPGLLERVYHKSLHFKLNKKGIFVETEKPIPIYIEGSKLECGYRCDLLVERKVIVEVKCVEALNDLHLAQVLTYLRVGGFKLGLLLNFNVLHLKNGIRRVINGNIE